MRELQGAIINSSLKSKYEKNFKTLLILIVCFLEIIFSEELGIGL